MSVSGEPETLIVAPVGLGTGPGLAGMPGRASSGLPGPMNCRTFRKSHVDFVDGLLGDKRSAKMYEHLDACGQCGRLDTAVRRGLLVARNLPQIQPSPDFMSRLHTRLRAPEARLPARARSRAGRIVIELSLAVAAAAGVIFALHPVHGQPSPAAAPRVAESRTGQDNPLRSGRERGLNDRSLNEALATMVPVLLPGVLASDPASVTLVDATSHAASLSP